MPTVSRVTLSAEQTCAKCKGKLDIGQVVVKDRSLKKTKGITTYYHTECPKE